MRTSVLDRPEKTPGWRPERVEIIEGQRQIAGVFDALGRSLGVSPWVLRIPACAVMAADAYGGRPWISIAMIIGYVIAYFTLPKTMSDIPLRPSPVTYLAVGGLLIVPLGLSILSMTRSSTPDVMATQATTPVSSVQTPAPSAGSPSAVPSPVAPSAALVPVVEAPVVPAGTQPGTPAGVPASAARADMLFRATDAVRAANATSTDPYDGPSNGRAIAAALDAAGFLKTADASVALTRPAWMYDAGQVTISQPYDGGVCGVVVRVSDVPLALMSPPQCIASANETFGPAGEQEAVKQFASTMKTLVKKVNKRAAANGDAPFDWDTAFVEEAVASGFSTIASADQAAANAVAKAGDRTLAVVAPGKRYFVTGTDEFIGQPLICWAEASIAASTPPVLFSGAVKCSPTTGT